MRLFVAVVPPAEPLQELEAALAPVRGSVPALRWSAPAGWHLTLAFLGDVGEDRLPDLSARLRRAAGRAAPFEIGLRGGGRFGRQVLWTGVGGDTTALTRLAASVAAAARRAGIPVEDRPYKPHLTLARSRTPIDLRPLADSLQHFQGTAWTVRHVELMRSVLGPEPRYEPLLAEPLGGDEVDGEEPSAPVDDLSDPAA